jgi:hypothetical protein
MNRAVDLTIRLPEEIADPASTISGFVRSFGSSKQQEIQQELRDWDEGFFDVEEKEEEFHSEIVAEIWKDSRVKELAVQLRNIADSIPKNPQKQNQNNHD